MIRNRTLFFFSRGPFSPPWGPVRFPVLWGGGWGGGGLLIHEPKWTQWVCKWSRFPPVAGSKNINQRKSPVSPTCMHISPCKLSTCLFFGRASATFSRHLKLDLRITFFIIAPVGGAHAEKMSLAQNMTWSKNGVLTLDIVWFVMGFPIESHWINCEWAILKSTVYLVLGHTHCNLSYRHTSIMLYIYISIDTHLQGWPTQVGK